MSNIADYIEHLHRELDKQTEDFRSRLYAQFPHSIHTFALSCPSCGSSLRRHSSTELKFCPFCGAAISSPTEEERELKPIYMLPHYESLEEETKAKIGTFERVYRNTFQQETKRPLVEKSAFNLLDFSPLVNPLASGLEIEMGLSVGKVMRDEYGKNTVLHFENKELELYNAARFSLREYQLCMRYDNTKKQALYYAGFPTDKTCLNLLNSIIDVRNEASHKKNISHEKFFFFYDNIYKFFSEYVDKLITIKMA